MCAGVCLFVCYNRKRLTENRAGRAMSMLPRGPVLNGVSERLRPGEWLRVAMKRLRPTPGSTTPGPGAPELSHHPSHCGVTSLVTQSCVGIFRDWICVQTRMCELHVHTNLGVCTHMHTCLYTCICVTPVHIHIK